MKNPAYIVELCLTQKGIEYIKNDKALAPKLFKRSIFSNSTFSTVNGTVCYAKSWKAAFDKGIIKNIIIWEKLNNIFDRTLYATALIENKGKMIFPNHTKYGKIREKKDLYYIDHEI